MTQLLSVSSVDAHYGAYHALQDASLSMKAGERLALFGHNGSGKSTLMKCCVGAIASVTGSIRFKDHDITPGRVPDNVRLGIGYVPQSSNVFTNLSVERNLAISGLMRGNENFDPIWTLFPTLKQRRVQKADTMSGGERQMLAFAMAIMTDPQILLLDEPTSGLSPKMSEIVLDAMAEISRERGIAVVLIEHNVPRTLNYVDRVIILKTGRIIKDGTREEILARDNLWSWF